MKKIIFALICFFSLVYADKKEIFFNQLIGSVRADQKWVIEKNDAGFLKLTCFEEEGETIMECLPSFDLKKYAFKSKDGKTEYLLELKDKAIVATGLKDGKKMKSSHFLKTPWIQQFSFGLKPFLISKEKTLEFCLLNPQSFTLQKMVAKKILFEQIEIDGKKFSAQKIIIKLAGFKGAFWEAELWFEKDSKDFLKYKATSGPNTPLTVIWLAKK